MKAKRAKNLAVSVKAASKQTGIPQPKISWSKAQGCEAFRANGNVELEVLRKWWTAERETEFAEYMVGDSSELRREALLFQRERREMLSDKRAKMNGTLIPLFEVKRDCAKFAGACKDKLLNCESTIVANAAAELKLSGEQQIKLRGLIAHEHREALLALSRGDWFKP